MFQLNFNDFNYSNIIDHKSMGLCTMTVLLNAIHSFTTNQYTTAVAIAAGVSTLAYNLIKIYKEVKKK